MSNNFIFYFTNYIQSRIMMKVVQIENIIQKGSEKYY